MRPEDFDDKQARQADRYILAVALIILVGLACAEWWPQ